MNRLQTNAKIKTGKFLPYCTGGVICLVFLLVLYAIKGIFPFGNGSAAIMDMCHGYLPMYYHLYDFLHGDKALFFDFYSGTGVNMVGIAAVNGLLSPMNLLFYLTSRDGLLNFINIFLIVKLVAASAASQFYFKKRFPELPLSYATAFSLLYALSGYVLLYYMHIIWLDVLILFPLLLYFGEKMLHGGKIFPYAICLALSLLCSFYLGVMALMTVFFVGGAYIFTLIKKEARPDAAVRLGIGTAIGGLLPMFLLLPGYLQMSASARYGFASDFKTLLASAPELNLYKTLMFYGLQLGFIFAFLLIVGYKKHPEKSAFALLSLLLMFVPLFVEGSAALWHFGSYKDFPYRFGFAAVFLVLALAAEQIRSEGDCLAAPEKNKNTRSAAYFLVIACTTANFILIKRAFASLGYTIGSLSKNMTTLICFAALTVVGVLMFLAVLLIENQKLRRIAALLLCVMQLCPFALMSFGTGSPIRYERAEHNTDYIEPALQIGKTAATDYTKLERIHNPDMSLNINYGFVAGKSALSNWTHQIPASLQNTMRSLGYSTTYTLLLDGGGTVFTDSLLNMRQTVSMRTMNDKLYRLVDEVGEYKLYDNLYSLPCGMICDAELLLSDFDSRNNIGGSAVFENQNRLYNALGGEGTLIRTLPVDSDGIYRFTANENEILYCTSPRSAWNSMKISVNGQIVSVPSYQKQDNTGYTAEYNNNCLELGVFDRETVTVQIETIGEGAKFDDLVFGFMSLDKMSALAEAHASDGVRICAEKNKITVKAETPAKDSYVFIPVAYDSGWRCTVNGEKTDIYTVAGSFTAIKLPASGDEAVFRFIPDGFLPGLLLTLLGAVLLIGLILAECKHKKITLSRIGDTVVWYVFAGLWACAVFVFYFLPSGYFIVGIFQVKG